MAKPSKGDIVRTFYGIHYNTCEVWEVSVTRGGWASRWVDGLPMHGINVPTGAEQQREVGMRYGLVDVFSMPTMLDGGDISKKQREALQEKANAMKADREAKKQEDQEPEK